MSDLFKKFVFFICFWHCLCCSSLIRSFLMSKLSDLLLSLFTKEWPERFTHNKRAFVSNSDSLTSLFRKELKCDLLKERIVFFLFRSQKTGRFARKIDDQIPNPGPFKDNLYLIFFNRKLRHTACLVRLLSVRVKLSMLQCIVKLESCTTI